MNQYKVLSMNPKDISHRNYMRIWQKNNRERVNSYAKAWRLKNAEKVNLKHKKDVANRKYPGKLTVKILQDMYESNIKKFGFLTCYLCLKKIKFGEDSLDHKIPFKRGGKNTKSNLGISHMKCNKMKHLSTPTEFLSKRVSK